MSDKEIAAKQYARPDALVSTDWLAAHLDDSAVRVLESDEDVLLYEVGHIPGALKIDWHADLNDPVLRDYIGREDFQRLLRRLGIDERTTAVLYGDKNNWWATYALWVFQLFGFTNTKILDGGRAKWEAEERPMTTDVRTVTPSTYTAKER
ncbi:MAG TPA: rhodanese-like domain-containing protein, partial [Gemmatimonadaceae bacterium]|nr:rhodanese-like domain-containing protein [Gemmatimonadaceae bacterium]